MFKSPKTIIMIFLIVFLLIYLVTRKKINKNEIPRIDIFMECLCPYCERFITSSFAKFLRNPGHSSLAMVRFFPYGNAVETEHDGYYEFNCQHGGNECYGNLIEVCALDKLEYEDGLQFMVCIEAEIRNYDQNFNKALTSCIKDKNMLKTIFKCVAGNEGNSLQHKVAIATPSNKKYVPWILFNGIYDKKIEIQILDDMIAFLCGLEENKNSTVCQGVE